MGKVGGVTRIHDVAGAAGYVCPLLVRASPGSSIQTLEPEKAEYANDTSA